MKRVAIICALSLFWTAPARSEETCALKQIASLPLTILPGGGVGVPATVAGHDVTLALGLSYPFSYIYRPFADSASLTMKSMPNGVSVENNGDTVKAIVIVPKLKLGSASGQNLQFLRLDNERPPTPNVVGLLGEDILQSFDVELDFPAMTMKLFSQDHCPGHVVYWSDSYAAVPMQFDKVRHPSIEMQLDGQTLSVDLSTDPGHGRMALAAAKRIFNFDERAQGVSSVLDASGRIEHYEHSFKVLSVGGINILNPKIDLKPDWSDCQPSFHPTRFTADITTDDRQTACYGRSDVELGLSELNKLRLYFAYKEKMLYITAASAAAPKAQ